MMFALKLITKFYLVIIVSVFPICDTREAISCFYNNITCTSTILACENTDVIILNDINWYVKQDCTQDVDTCVQCCMYDVSDTHHTLSTTDNIEIYKTCHRTSSCDPYTDLVPPDGFHNGYIHINYTCQQGTSTKTDTESESSDVVYAIIFPILGLCIIVCAVITYLWFVKQRQGIKCPIAIICNKNDRQQNDADEATIKKEEIRNSPNSIIEHIPDNANAVNVTNEPDDMYSNEVNRDVSLADNSHTASQNTSECLFTDKNTNSIACIEEQDIHGDPNPKKKGHTACGVETQEKPLTHINPSEDTTSKANATQNNQVIHEVIDEINRDHTYTGSNKSTSVTECVDTNKPREPRIVYSHGVTECHAVVEKCSPQMNNRRKQHQRKLHYKTEKRKMQRSRKQQLLFLKNMRLLRKHFLFDKKSKEKDNRSSSDDYSPSSTTSDDSSCDSEETEQKLSFTDDTGVVEDTIKEDDSKLLEVSDHKRKVKNQPNTDKGTDVNENDMKVDEICPNGVSPKIEPSVQKIVLTSVEISDKSPKDNSCFVTDGSILSEDTNCKTVGNIPKEYTPIIQSTAQTENQAVPKILAHDKLHNIEQIPAEGPIATSSFRYTKAYKTSDIKSSDKDITTKGMTNGTDEFGLQSEMSLPAWCIPKPPVTKQDVDSRRETTETVLNRSMSLNESDKRCSDVINKRRKRKYESMRHAKRETIFDILQKLEAVPKRSILKKSKSMHVTKHEVQTNQKDNYNRHTDAFIDDTNLTDSDKIHQLSEPIGVKVLQSHSTCTITDDDSSSITSLSDDTTPFDNVQYDTSETTAQNDAGSLTGNAPLQGDKLFAPKHTAETTRYDGMHTYNCGIISSNLRQNLQTDIQDTSTQIDTVVDRGTGIDETSSISDDNISAQKQASIKEKLLQKSSSDTPMTHEEMDSFEELNNQSLAFDERAYLDTLWTSPKLNSNSNDTMMKTEGINNVPDLIHDIKDNSKCMQQENRDMSCNHNDGGNCTTEHHAINTLRDPEMEQKPFKDNSSNMGLGFVPEQDELETGTEYEYDSNDTHNRLYSIYKSVSSVPNDVPGDSQTLQQDTFSELDYDIKGAGKVSVKGPKQQPSPIPSISLRHSYKSAVGSNIQETHTDCQLPERPKSSLGMRSRVAEMYNYYQQQQQQQQINKTKSFNDKDALKPVVTEKKVPPTTFTYNSPVAIPSSSQHFDRSYSQRGEKMNEPPRKKTPRTKNLVSTSTSFKNPPDNKAQVLPRTKSKESQPKLQKYHTVNNLEGLSEQVPSKLVGDFSDISHSTPRKTPRLNNGNYSLGHMNNTKQQMGGMSSGLIPPPPDNVSNSLFSSNVKKPSYIDGTTVRRSKSLMFGSTNEVNGNTSSSYNRGLTNKNSKEMDKKNRSAYSYSEDQSMKESKKVTLNDLMRKTKRQTVVIEHETKTTATEPKRLLNRRTNNNYMLQDTRETGEVARERPTSAQSGHYSSRNYNGSNLYRNKSMSNRKLDDAQTFKNSPRVVNYLNRPNTGNKHPYDRGNYSGSQRPLTGWSRWNQTVSANSTLNQLKQPSAGSVAPFDEYDSELEKFFENSSDEEVLKIDNNTNYDRDRTSVSRSKSWRT